MTDFDMYLKMLLSDMQGNTIASRMLNKDKKRLTFNILPDKPQTGNVYVSSYGNLVTPTDTRQKWTAYIYRQRMESRK